MAKSKTTTTINAFLKLASMPIRLDSDADEKDGYQVSMLVFDTGNETYAIAVENVEGIVDCPRITPLPNPPDDIIGVASVRGRMTLVMCLNGNSIPGESRQRLILLKGDAQLGLFADRIDDVVSFPKKELRKAVNRKGDRVTEAKGQDKWSAFFHHRGRRIPVVELDQLTEA
jgi:chemotaxis signal transduction protein